MKELAEEILDIRNQIWVLTDKIPMTRRQWEEFEIIKQRLYRIQEKLREPLFDSEELK